MHDEGYISELLRPSSRVLSVKGLYFVGSERFRLVLALQSVAERSDWCPTSNRPSQLELTGWRREQHYPPTGLGFPSHESLVLEMINRTNIFPKLALCLTSTLGCCEINFEA